MNENIHTVTLHFERDITDHEKDDLAYICSKTIAELIEDKYPLKSVEINGELWFH